MVLPVVDHCFQNNSCPENSQCRTPPGANETECDCNPGFTENLCQCEYFRLLFKLKHSGDKVDEFCAELLTRPKPKSHICNTKGPGIFIIFYCSYPFVVSVHWKITFVLTTTDGMTTHWRDINQDPRTFNSSTIH